MTDLDEAVMQDPIVLAKSPINNFIVVEGEFPGSIRTFYVSPYIVFPMDPDIPETATMLILRYRYMKSIHTGLHIYSFDGWSVGQ